MLGGVLNSLNQTVKQGCKQVNTNQVLKFQDYSFNFISNTNRARAQANQQTILYVQV